MESQRIAFNVRSPARSMGAPTMTICCGSCAAACLHQPCASASAQGTTQIITIVYLVSGAPTVRWTARRPSIMSGIQVRARMCNSHKVPVTVGPPVTVFHALQPTTGTAAAAYSLPKNYWRTRACLLHVRSCCAQRTLCATPALRLQVVGTRPPAGRTAKSWPCDTHYRTKSKHVACPEHLMLGKRICG